MKLKEDTKKEGDIAINNNDMGSRTTGTIMVPTKITEITLEIHMDLSVDRKMAMDKTHTMKIALQAPAVKVKCKYRVTIVTSAIIIQ